jgi:hypothetical protein
MYYNTSIASVIKLIAYCILLFLPPHLIDIDLKKYGVVEKGVIGVGAKATISTIVALLVTLWGLYLLSKLLA